MIDRGFEIKDVENAGVGVEAETLRAASNDTDIQQLCRFDHFIEIKPLTVEFLFGLGAGHQGGFVAGIAEHSETRDTTIPVMALEDDADHSVIEGHTFRVALWIRARAVPQLGHG